MADTEPRHPNEAAVSRDALLHGDVFLDGRTGRHVSAENVRSVSVEFNGPTRVNGVPVEILAAEWTDEGLVVHGRVEAAARLMKLVEETTGQLGVAIQRFGYAAAEVAAQFGQAASLATPKTVSDNGPYVNSPRGREPVHACRYTDETGVTVPSPTVNGLGREHIVDHLPVEHRVPYVQLPVELGGLPDDAPERHIPRANRADRRRAKKRGKRA